MGLFGGANKTKFQAEMGINNLKKPSALGLLRSNTDFRNYGKSKAGKLTFGSEVRKRGDQCEYLRYLGNKGSLGLLLCINMNCLVCKSKKYISVYMWYFMMMIWCSV